MHNVGSIFRSSDGARIEELLLTGFTPVPPRPEITKTALGSTESVPWKYVKNSKEKINELKQTHPKMNIYDRYDMAINEYKEEWKKINQDDN